MKVDYWDISLNEIEIIDIIQSSLLNKKNTNTYFLLNLNKEKYNYLEKCVYDIGMFHLNKLNIPLTDEVFIEFWVKNETEITNLHIDCDEYSLNTTKYLPFLSCITYLNDHNLPTLITEIDIEKYKYKKFNNENSVNIIFPKKKTHISFDGSFFHGMVNIFNEKNNNYNRNILAINLWKTKPTNIPYYISNIRTLHVEDAQSVHVLNEKMCRILYNKIDNRLDIFENKNKKNVPTTNRLDYFFYEKVLYDNILYLSDFSNLLKSDYSNNICFFNIINETPISVNHNISIPNNRFVLEKWYTPMMCDWIINESINYGNIYGWTTTRHVNYPTTDIPLKRIPSLYSFFLFSFESIFKKIGKLYGIPIPNVDINNSDIFVVKYEMNAQQELEPHIDGSDVTISIMLSDSKDYMGGGTQFDSDKFVYYLEKGDILIHNGKDMHAGLKITKGTRYVLVMFINFQK